MRKKNCLMALLILAFPLSMAMASVPVQASPEVRFYVKMPDGYIPGAQPGMYVLVEVCVDTTEPLVAWTISIKFNPAALQVGWWYYPPPPMPPQLYDAVEGPFLTNYCTSIGWTGPGKGTTFVKGSIDNEGGSVTATSCGINNWALLPTGSGATGTGQTLAYYYFTSQSLTEYSPLDLFNCEYGTMAGTFTVDVVDDGHYASLPPVPEFPLGSVAPIALIAAIAYIWWVTKRKTREAM